MADNPLRSSSNPSLSIHHCSLFAVMELAALAKWLLPEIMEFAALALLMTAKSQVSGFRKGQQPLQKKKRVGTSKASLKAAPNNLHHVYATASAAEKIVP